MEVTTIEIECTGCLKKHVRHVRVIEPESFSPTGTKSVLSQFWCPKCGEVNAVRYGYRRENDNSITAHVLSQHEPIGAFHSFDKASGEED